MRAQGYSLLGLSARGDKWLSFAETTGNHCLKRLSTFVSSEGDGFQTLKQIFKKALQ